MIRIYNNSDIKFHVTDIDGISDRFIIKFYTTNKDFNICKTENDIVVETTEDEFGNISEKKVLKLNWNELSTIGDGVLNYVLNVYRDDADFDDSVYNKTYSRTTKYYIASNLDVTEEDTESFSQMLAELQAEVDLKANEEDVYSKSEIDEIIAGGGLDPTLYYTKSEIDELMDEIDVSDQLANYYTKTESDAAIGNEAGARQLTDQTLQSNIDALSTTVLSNKTATDTAIAAERQNRENADTTITNALNAEITRATTAEQTNATAISNEATARQSADNTLQGEIDTLTNSVYTKSEIDDIIDAIETGQADLTNYYTKTEIDNKGYLTQHQDISGKANTADLATVATTGDYDDLINKPTIPTVPTNVSDFTNDAGYLTQHQSLSNYYTKSEVDQAISDIDVTDQLSDYALKTDIVQSDWNVSDSSNNAFIKNRPFYGTTTYSVLDNETISCVQNGPTHGGGVLTLSENLVVGNTYKVTIDGESYVVTAKQFNGEISLNLSDDASSPFNDSWSIFSTSGNTSYTICINGAIGNTANIKVEKEGVLAEKQLPSEYVNLSEYETKADNRNYLNVNYYTQSTIDTKLSNKANTSDLATVATSGSYNDLTDKPTIPTVPTNVSAFTNDAGYLTSHQDISGKQDVLSGTAKQILIANNVVGFPDDLLIDCGEY